MTDKRDHILTATLDLILEQGLQSTSMSQITKRAEVGMGTVYNYFPNKEELVNMLYSEIKKSMSDYVLHEYDTTLPIIEQFIYLWSNIVRFGCQYSKQFQFVEQLTYSPYIQASHKESDYGLVNQFYQLLHDAQTQGMVKDLPMDVLASLTYGALTALVRAHVSGKIKLDDELIQKAVEACWDAIKR